MSSYQPGIPTGTVNLDVDYQNIQNNFQQLDTTFGQNHVTFSNGTPQNGYHTKVALTPMATPAAIAGYGQLFSNTVTDVNNDTALFWLTGGNRLIKLTENIVPVASGNGYSFLPGGLIVQWGRKITPLTGGSGGTITFATESGTDNIAFPNNCFAVWTNLIYVSGNLPTSDNAATIAIQNPGFGATSFTWRCQTPSNRYTGFFWMALGN